MAFYDCVRTLGIMYRLRPTLREDILLYIILLYIIH